MTLKKFLMFISNDDGANPIDCHLSEDIPGRIEEMSLLSWNFERTGLVAPLNYLQLGFSDMNTQTITNNSDSRLLPVPVWPDPTGAVYWGAASTTGFKIPVNNPLGRQKSFWVSLYGEGRAPALVTNVNLRICLWFELTCNIDTGGLRWNAGGGEVPSNF